MLNHVVYVLGAGFSDPLGLPVMSNFLEKSKDMYFDNKDKQGELEHFQKVYDTIKEMNVTKSYFKADLFNIEEILSILEMSHNLENLETDSSDNFFIKYIIDVINHYMPKLVPYEKIRETNEWENFIFGDNPLPIHKQLHNQYGFFILSLLNIKISRIVTKDYVDDIVNFEYTRNEPLYNIYSIITLNYDMVLEKFENFVIDKSENKILFQKACNIPINENSDNLSVLAKLHGSVDTGDIIPPTWNKLLTQKNILNSWKWAFKLLGSANQIRLIGYSLPITDSYVKYLFKSAIINSKHLKKIDVICLDEDGSVKERYDNFIRFNNYRFKSGDFSEYLKINYDMIKKTRIPNGTGEMIAFESLERVHEQYMSEDT